MEVRGQEKVIHVQVNKDLVTKEIVVDDVLVSTGRRPNIEVSTCRVMCCTIPLSLSPSCPVLLFFFCRLVAYY